MNTNPTPDLYEIRVAGDPSPQWSEWFAGFTITAQGGETCLSGPVADQAALYGLLRRVRDLGLSLLSVSQVTPPAEPSPSTPNQE